MAFEDGRDADARDGGHGDACRAGPGGEVTAGAVVLRIGPRREVAWMGSHACGRHAGALDATFAGAVELGGAIRAGVTGAAGSRRGSSPVRRYVLLDGTHACTARFGAAASPVRSDDLQAA